MCWSAQLSIYTMDLVLLLACVSKWANPSFVLVSPLVDFKSRPFSNKHKEVIANNGTNKVPVKQNFAHM